MDHHNPTGNPNGFDGWVGNHLDPTGRNHRSNILEKAAEMMSQCQEKWRTLQVWSAKFHTHFPSAGSVDLLQHLVIYVCVSSSFSVSFLFFVVFYIVLFSPHVPIIMNHNVEL